MVESSALIPIIVGFSLGGYAINAIINSPEEVAKITDQTSSNKLQDEKRESSQKAKKGKQAKKERLSEQKE